jgi:hypothetical protein
MCNLICSGNSALKLHSAHPNWRILRKVDQVLLAKYRTGKNNIGEIEEIPKIKELSQKEGIFLVFVPRFKK